MYAQEVLPEGFPAREFDGVVAEFARNEADEYRKHFVAIQQEQVEAKDPNALTDKEVEFLTNLWPMQLRCLQTDELTRRLQETGFDTTSMYNPHAYDDAEELRDVPYRNRIGDSWGHIVSRVSWEGSELYVDPFWQQFVIRKAGVDLEEVFQNVDASIAPEEAILVYAAGSVPELTFAYAGTVRALQEKIARGALKGKIPSFTRDYDIRLAMLQQASIDLPRVALHPYKELIRVADTIWGPDNYIEQSDAAIGNLILMSQR